MLSQSQLKPTAWAGGLQARSRSLQLWTSCWDLVGNQGQWGFSSRAEAGRALTSRLPWTGRPYTERACGAWCLVWIRTPESFTCCPMETPRASSLTLRAHRASVPLGVWQHAFFSNPLLRVWSLILESVEGGERGKHQCERETLVSNFFSDRFKPALPRVLVHLC